MAQGRKGREGAARKARAGTEPRPYNERRGRGYFASLSTGSDRPYKGRSGRGAPAPTLKGVGGHAGPPLQRIDIVVGNGGRPPPLREGQAPPLRRTIRVGGGKKSEGGYGAPPLQKTNRAGSTRPYNERRGRGYFASPFAALRVACGQLKTGSDRTLRRKGVGGHAGPPLQRTIRAGSTGPSYPQQLPGISAEDFLLLFPGK